MAVWSAAGLRRLTQAYQQNERTTAARTTAAARRIWDRYGGVDDADLAAWLTRILPLVEAGQTHTVRATDVYVARYVTAATDQPARPTGLAPAALTGVSVRNVAPEVEYARPVVTARAALARSIPYQEALRLGALRAVALVDADLALARRAAADEAMRAHNIAWYRRVPAADACRRCMLAATQRYKRGDLLPIHDHCHCVVQPGVGPDPGHVIAPQTLQRLKTDPRIGTTRRVGPGDLADLYREQVAVRHHGELGPVLVDKRHRFTSLADIS